jgi:hypothetical protein
MVVWLALRAASTAAERRTVVWLAAATVLGVLPMVGGVPDGRMLLIPLLTSMPLVATAIDAAWRSPAPRLNLVVRAYGGMLLFMHVAIAVLVRAGGTAVMVDAARQQHALAVTADLTRCSAGAPVFLLTGADPALSLGAGPALRFHRPDMVARHPRFTVLSMAPHDQRVERTGEHQVILDILGEPRRGTIFERLFRDSPLAVDQGVAFEWFGARVLAAERGFETRVAFELPVDACLLTLARGRLVGQPLPPVGTSVQVPHEPGPLGL